MEGMAIKRPSPKRSSSYAVVTWFSEQEQTRKGIVHKGICPKSGIPQMIKKCLKQEMSNK
eukprot:5707766-Amphidinium_carterae.1